MHRRIVANEIAGLDKQIEKIDAASGVPSILDIRRAWVAAPPATEERDPHCSSLKTHRVSRQLAEPTDQLVDLAISIKWVTTPCGRKVAVLGELVAAFRRASRGFVISIGADKYGERRQVDPQVQSGTKCST